MKVTETMDDLRSDLQDLYSHEDKLKVLSQNLTLKKKLQHIHKTVQETFPFIARIAIAIYDPDTKVLKTYLHSSGDDNPLEHYQSVIDDAPSLKEILKKGKPRVVNKLVTFEKGSHEHTKRLGQSGYGSSYTLPLYNDGEFYGFVFFNSYETDVFTESNLNAIDVYGHLISLLVINEMSSILVLSAALKTTNRLTYLRDPETGNHLDRMSRYSRIIAKALAEKYKLDDEYIEHVFMFAPLHDIGKIGIPDNILLKTGPLTDEESRIMRTHTEKGRQMIDELLTNFGLEHIQHADILRSIARDHHEAVNGTGYPAGKTDKEIPLEARIVAVADVFDALTSKRPYKEAWTNDEAFDTLKKLAGAQLDQECVNALIKNKAAVEEIQSRFQEDYFG